MKWALGWHQLVGGCSGGLLIEHWGGPPHCELDPEYQGGCWSASCRADQHAGSWRCSMPETLGEGTSVGCWGVNQGAPLLEHY